MCVRVCVRVCVCFRVCLCVCLYVCVCMYAHGRCRHLPALARHKRYVQGGTRMHAWRTTALGPGSKSQVAGRQMNLERSEHALLRGASEHRLLQGGIL